MSEQSCWTLVWTSGEPVPPLDENTGHEDQGFMVYRSREAAEAAAEHQNELYMGSDGEHIIAVPVESVGLRIVRVPEVNND